MSGPQIMGEDGADFGALRGRRILFVHIDDILGQGSASMVGKRVEVVTRSRRRAGHVIYG